MISGEVCTGTWHECCEAGDEVSGVEEDVGGECIQALKSDDRFGGRGLVLGNTVRSLDQGETGRSFLFSAYLWEAGARVPVSLTCATSGSGRRVTAVGKADPSTGVDVAQR